jgi:glycosyltransferase involved in cell wall biosynthesis
MSGTATPISILILTKDEQEHLPHLLDTLGGFGEIVLLDSMSTDRTVQIAEQRGCRVVQRAFDNWAAHQNWAMEHIEFKYPWVFYLDADERMTLALREEISGVAAMSDPPHRAYFVARDNYLFGRCLKHAMRDGFVMRFFQPGAVRFERLVNPQPVVLDGKPGYLRQRFIHYHFSRGFTQWFEKHNRYSIWEAQEWIAAERKTQVPWKSLWSRDRHARQQALKRLSFALPGRPMLKFLYLYLCKRGFLDGSAGFHCSVLMGIFEYMIGLKVREMKRREAGFDV